MGRAHAGGGWVWGAGHVLCGVPGRRRSHLGERGVRVWRRPARALPGCPHGRCAPGLSRVSRSPQPSEGRVSHFTDDRLRRRPRKLTEVMQLVIWEALVRI